MNKSGNIKIVALNRKASFNYFLSDFIECGIVLLGTEIKSIREGGISISDSYVVFRNAEAYIINMNITPYSKGNIFNQDSLRSRKLLLHKKEISKLEAKVAQGGYSIVPTKVYFSNGRCKLEIALAKGKKLYDKREDKKQKDVAKEVAQSIKKFNNK
ncbi:MAG: SsrA-binding protein SmpB [Erysipelotrichaceae bacterium]|nr:SsrA-binding protein SmpB [Erysipelotrichaceae bacterium]